MDADWSDVEAFESNGRRVGRFIALVEQCRVRHYQSTGS